MVIIQNYCEEINKIEQEVQNCKKCDLHITRKNPVFGEGHKYVKVMFVGEAPGRNEDIQGRPFVGRAGILLNELIHSIGLERKDIYITNIIKCRPPKNRNPLKKEITICKLYLDKQIDIIRPKVIAPLGNFSSSYILEKFNCKCKNIGMIHGKTFDIKIQSFEISIIPLYHPAAAIYNPNLKDLLIRDFKSIPAALTKK